MQLEELCLALSTETLIRNSIVDDEEVDSIKEKILGHCITNKIRGLVEEKRGRGVFSGDIWTEIAEFYRYQKMYPERREALGQKPAFGDVVQTDEVCCNWPDCEIDIYLERDHIIPRSCLTDNKKRIGKRWDLNGQWLCSYHNRVKTDGIIVGVLMLDM